MSNFIVPILLLTDGIIISLAGVFAPNIGLDPNATWGRSRLILVSLGTVLIFISLLTFSPRKKKNFFLEKTIKSETTKTIFLVTHLWLIIFIAYAGLITYGNFTTWDHTTRYYTQLADSFSNGNLYIDRQPDQALVEAVDPYNSTSRPPVDDEIWDMSLYNGKLYLYWGPVPALLITPIQIIFDKKITDNYLVFFFFAGLLIFNSLIILKLWKNFFSELPARYLFICILLIGLILPILGATNKPNIYKAAIGAGHFFLVGGMYFSLVIFEQRSSFFDSRNLFLVGLFWTLSVGSRAINVVSVIFLVFMIVFWVAKKLPKPISWLQYFHAVAPLFIPLIVGALIIGWYNWARFDSPLEFGLKYQITTFNLNEDANLVFEPGYFFLNLYTYIFNPYEILPGFPFIQSTIASHALQKFNIIMPQIYYAGSVTGLLFSAPFLILGLVHLFSKNKTIKEYSSTSPQSYSFILLFFSGSFFLNFSIILFYFFGQTRFLVDIISQITLIAIIGYWKIISNNLRLNSFQSKLFLALANFLIIFTICTSILLAFSSERNWFETLNPQFFERINEFLNLQK